MTVPGVKLWQFSDEIVSTRESKLPRSSWVKRLFYESGSPSGYKESHCQKSVEGPKPHCEDPGIEPFPVSLFDSSGVYICKSIANDLRHGNYVCKSKVIYLFDSAKIHRNLHDVKVVREIKRYWIDWACEDGSILVFQQTVNYRHTQAFDLVGSHFHAFVDIPYVSLYMQVAIEIPVEFPYVIQ